MSIHTRGPLSCVGGPIGHTWANAGVATTAAAVPSTARRDICSENSWLLISIVSPVFKRSLLNLSSNRLCNNAIGGGCTLWVKSRHSVANCDVRSTPESDLGCIFSDVRYGARADINPRVLTAVRVHLASLARMCRQSGSRSPCQHSYPHWP